MIRFNYPKQNGNSFLPASLLALGDLGRLKFKGSITVSPDEFPCLEPAFYIHQSCGMENTNMGQWDTVLISHCCYNKVPQTVV